MFGPRRPVLGTALLIGASRSAARREADKQSAAAAQQSDDVDRQLTAKLQEEEARRRQQEEQEARIQKAVEEALKKNAPASAVGAGETAIEQPKAAVLAPEPGDAGRRGSFVSVPLPLTGVMPAAARAAGDVLFCGRCGVRVEVGDGFCRRCGTGLRG